MSLGLGESRGGARRTSWRRRFFRVVLIAVVLFGLGVIAYRSGSELARQDVSHLQNANTELSEQITLLTQSNKRLEALAKASQAREREWRDRHSQEVPTGKAKDLLALIQAHLAAGANPERLELFISAGARPPVCDNDPRTKRFLVRTPLYEGPNDAVTFAANTLTVTAAGESAIDAAGNREAWFDPSKPITLRVIALDGRRSETAGPLPLHHAVVSGDWEYRFSVVNGASRGFVRVTADRCAIAE